MNRCENVVLTRDQFGEQLWEKVGEQLHLLIQAGYVCVVREDEFDIVTIEYQHGNYEYGYARPCWLYPKEEETVAYKDAEDWSDSDGNN
jgi:hypothetical protein